jgi:hypothetical protein
MGGGGGGSVLGDVARVVANPVAATGDLYGNALGQGNVGTKYLDPMKYGERAQAAGDVAAGGGGTDAIGRALIKGQPGPAGQPGFAVDDTADNRKMLDSIAINRAGRQTDMAEGRARGEEIFKEGNLGRVDAGRNEETHNIIEARRAQAKGFTGQQRQMMREEGLSNVMQQNAGQERNFRAQMAAQGMRGPAVAAALARMKAGATGQMAESERSLQLANIAQQNTGLNSLEQSTNAAQAGELGRQQFNIGQANKERFGQLGTEMGYASLGAGDRAAAVQRLIGGQMAQASAAANSGGGGGKK